MQRVALARVVLGQVRIALPEAVQISVCEPGKAGVLGSVIAGEAAPRQAVAVRVSNRLAKSRRAGEISFAARIAPRALRIPVPRFDRQFGVLVAGQWLPTGGKRCVQCRWNQ